jgi:CheY-like chemotaxis protein
MLPTLAADPLPAGAPARPGILIADDLVPLRRMCERVLVQHGFTVWGADNGTEAVILYLRHQHEIDLVLLDVEMPLIDGRATLAALRRLDPSVRCCFMTGGPDALDPEELLSLGALRVFAKPLQPADLAAELHSLVAVR